jgi:ribosomal protein S14
MYEVEIYGRVRRAVRVEGRSQRAVAREFGLSRETVRKMLQYAVPPGYQRQQPIKRPKLGPWLGVIDAILNDDKQRPQAILAALEELVREGDIALILPRIVVDEFARNKARIIEESSRSLPRRTARADQPKTKTASAGRKKKPTGLPIGSCIQLDIARKPFNDLNAVLRKPHLHAYLERFGDAIFRRGAQSRLSS